MQFITIRISSIKIAHGGDFNSSACITLFLNFVGFLQHFMLCTVQPSSHKTLRPILSELLLTEVLIVGGGGGVGVAVGT
jgi:hypothetical protein